MADGLEVVDLPRLQYIRHLAAEHRGARDHGATTLGLMLGKQIKDPEYTDLDVCTKENTTTCVGKRLRSGRGPGDRAGPLLGLRGVSS
jgi:hypothetical protein